MAKKKKNKIYLIGNAHIDAVWLWQWQEGLSEIKATFRSALDRMNEYDDFIFVCSGACYYKWVEENSPEMFDEIKKRVAEGRWQTAGGWWLQPDCNLPAGESFARHSLYGQRYFYEKFGFTCETGYNIDSFGHSYMIPQILAKSGMKNYVFMRPGPNVAKVPDPLFWWESPDGSRVLAFRVLDDHYNNSFRTLEEVISGTEGKNNLNTEKIMVFFGVGNHGGGPTIKALEIIEKKQRELGADRLFISGVNEYFDDVRGECPQKNVYDKDIQHFGSGCYATNFEFKKKHRHLEQLLLSAEKWNLLSGTILNYPDNSRRIKSAWETVMYHQFHDIMGGCSLQDALKDADAALGHAEYLTAGVLNGSLQALSWAVNTEKPAAKRSKEKSGRVWDYAGAGAPLVVFNPLPFPARYPITLDVVPKTITNAQGAKVDMQIIKGRFIMKNKSAGSLFMADLPALGYTTYWLHMPEKTDEFEKEEPAENNFVLKNENLIVSIDEKTGLIKRIYSLKDKLDILKNPSARPIVIDEFETDTWGNGFDTFNDVVGEFELKSLSVIENGPVRSTIRAEFIYGASQLRQEYHLYSGSSDVDVDVRVNWQEKHKILKLAFDVNAKYPLATYSCPYGHISKPCDGKEEPGLMWMDISGTSSGGKLCGLGLACQARYSYSALKNSMRLNVVRSPVFADYNSQDGRFEGVEHMDQGIHKFSYKLVPHSGDWRSSGIIRKALCLNNPAQKVHETYHKGPLPLTMENVNVSCEQIVMTVLKRPEDENLSGTVARFYETFGRECETRVKIPALNVDISLDFSAFEIRTILIKPDGDFEEIPITELDF